MTELSADIKRTAGLDERLEQQISPEVAVVLEKMYRNEALGEEEKSILVNPVEAGAIMSIKSNRPINHRYIKEISRSTIGKDKKPVKNKRLEPAKVAGRTYLYLLGSVYDLKPVAERSTKRGSDHTQDEDLDPAA